METSSLSINESSCNFKLHMSPSSKDLSDNSNNNNNNNEDRKSLKQETCNNVISKRKQLRQYNDELEKHLRRQQTDNELLKQENFLKKFSTRSQIVNESTSQSFDHKDHHIKELNSPSSEKKSKSSNRFSCSSSNSPIIKHKTNHSKKFENEISDDNNKQLMTGSNTNSLAAETKSVANSFLILKNSDKKIKNKEHKKFKKNSLLYNKQYSVASLNSNNSTNWKKKSLLYIYFQKLLIKCNYFVLSPDDNCMFAWLIVLNVCIMYNIWLVIARQSFENLQTLFSFYWRIADSLSDTIYLLDVFVHFRTGYLEQGLLVYDSKKLAINYIKSKNFLLDIFSLAPFELFQLKLGFSLPILRFPRFFKVYRSIQLYYITESRTLYPNVWRVTNLTHILFLLGHWFAGFYFLISKAEGFKGHWSYPEPVDEFALLPRMYLRCLYWSTLTLTTIGDLPPPETNWQWLREMSNSRYLFSIAVHYLAVFVIALIVGQVGNVITNRNANRVEFERLLDGAKQYMRNHNVPTEMQKRVQRWYDYSWSRGRMNGAGDIHSIGLLPDKLKTELALHVNLETLRKVTIFQECQPEFLHDLVLKMRAYIFTPGDMICRKGEVAREMFIIADGVLEVIGESGQVLTKMYSGDFFGEIGILNIEGASNRRTADVRSVGYAELFSLSKEDVLSAVKDYPDAERILIEYGKRRLNQNVKNAASVNNSKTNLGSQSESIATIAKEEKSESQTSTSLKDLKPKQSKEVLLSSPKFKKIDSDLELGLNVISEENRGLTTDMLGIPTLVKSPPPEILISNLNSTELSKISLKEEILEKHLMFSKNSKTFDYRGVMDALEDVLKLCVVGDVKDLNKVEMIENKLVKLKEQISDTKDAKIEYFEDLVLQKDAKIKLLESRIKILQKYVTQKDS